MKKIIFSFLGLALALWNASAETPGEPVPLTLEQALQIALSENVSVRVADLEIQRTGYARKGSYAALFPQIDGSGSYQRTIKKQVMYMDFDMSKMMGGGASLPGGDTGTEEAAAKPASSDGFEVGRWNTWSAGVSASMPLVNAQLWKSLKISQPTCAAMSTSAIQRTTTCRTIRPPKTASAEKTRTCTAT